MGGVPYGGDRGIEIAVLLSKLRELGAQGLFFFVGHGKQGCFLSLAGVIVEG